MIFTSIDLELNKDGNKTTDIIQIGAVIGNVHTGEILETLRLYVSIPTPLDPFIIQLTGITSTILDKQGTSLLEAYYKLREAHIKHNSHKMLIQWGSGDERELKEQLLDVGMPIEQWEFGRTYFNVKQMCQEIALSKKQTLQGGLKKHCNKFNVTFEGPAHDALNDAKGTFDLFCHLLTKYKNI